MHTSSQSPEDSGRHNWLIWPSEADKSTASPAARNRRSDTRRPAFPITQRDWSSAWAKRTLPRWGAGIAHRKLLTDSWLLSVAVSLLRRGRAWIPAGRSSDSSAGRNPDLNRPFLPARPGLDCDCPKPFAFPPAGGSGSLPATRAVCCDSRAPARPAPRRPAPRRPAPRGPGGRAPSPATRRRGTNARTTGRHR